MDYFPKSLQIEKSYKLDNIIIPTIKNLKNDLFKNLIAIKRKGEYLRI